MHKLGCLALLLGMVLPAWAAGKPPATVAGFVRNASGVPQMGATVDVLDAASRTLRVFTDDKGFFSVGGLVPGVYTVRVSAPSFLPALREKLGLRPAATLTLNITLNTLFEALQLSSPATGVSDTDDWKWTLRSVSNRPILRALDESSSSTAKLNKSESGDKDLKGTVSFLAGTAAKGYGSASDMSTGFSVEHSLFSSGTVGLYGNVGYGSGAPTAVLRTSFSHKMGNGSQPTISLTARRLAAPDANLHASPLQSLALTTSDDLVLGDVLELKFGSEVQTIQFMGRVNSVQPFGTADLHVSPNTILEYRYASSVPNHDGLTPDSDFNDTSPRMSIAAFTPALEKMHHQEVSVSRRIGKTSVQAALYSDRIADTAITGIGEAGIENGEVLPDAYSGTFTYQGRDLETRGMRLVLQQKLASDLTATLDYGYGGVLDLFASNVPLQQVRDSLRKEERHSVAGKLSGTVPHSRTHWVASYRWVNGQALTPVDMFNGSAGQADPYLNFLVRQPIPGTGFLPCKMEAIVDIRNLLAQGYVPVMGQDGRTVYLVQAGRAVRGGLAFTF
ncbi:MAG TPA: carboxypeptidase-like regulatory domain-containing protein [Terriglobales bacterium]|nr:carboxypeptidase-like regulatory domain-containing protein [Terriglobales bacterium]